jgi:hypothetical protein
MIVFISTALQLQLIITAHTLNSLATSVWQSLTIVWISNWPLVSRIQNQSHIATGG